MQQAAVHQHGARMKSVTDCKVVQGVFRLQPATRSGRPVYQAQASSRQAADKARPSARRVAYRGLLRALTSQFRKESWPWIWELLSPVLAGPPLPLTDTVDPEALADPDSRFTTINGISIHYKEFTGYTSSEGSTGDMVSSTAAVHGSDDSSIVGCSGVTASVDSAVGYSDGSAGFVDPAEVYRNMASASFDTTDGLSDGFAASSTWQGFTSPGLQQQNVQAAAGASVPRQLVPPNMLMLHGFNGSEFNWRLVAQPMADNMVAHVQSVAADGAPAYCDEPALSSSDGNSNNNGTGVEAGSTAGSASVGGMPHWSQQQQVEEPVCTAVAYDRPPFGLSGRPLKWTAGEETDPYTLSGGVEIAAGMIQQLGLGSVVVMGHSAGAPIALELAIRYPELVCGVVLVSPAISTSSKGLLASSDLGRLLRFAYTRALLSNDALGLNYVRQMIRKREAEVRAGKLGVYHDDAEFFTPEVLEGFLRPLRAHDWDRASLAMFRSFSVGGSNTRWQDVKAPVLVVQGDKDETIPPHMARAVVGKLEEAGCIAQYVELPRCGHLPMEERPEQFVSAVSDFMSRFCCQPSTAEGGSDVEGQQLLQQRVRAGASGDVGGRSWVAGAAGGRSQQEVLGSMQDAMDPVRQRMSKDYQQ